MSVLLPEILSWHKNLCLCVLTQVQYFHVIVEITVHKCLPKKQLKAGYCHLCYLTLAFGVSEGIL